LFQIPDTSRARVMADRLKPHEANIE